MIEEKIYNCLLCFKFALKNDPLLKTFFTSLVHPAPQNTTRSKE